MTALKPMRAATIEDFQSLRYPLLASPKMDGVRCLIQGGRALSRTSKPIPNAAVSAFLQALPVEGFDGELMVHGTSFGDVTSVFMSYRKTLPASWYYAVFDCMPSRPGEPYSERLARLTAQHAALPEVARRHVVVTVQLEVRTAAELTTFEEACLKAGFEGVMVRRGSAPYKHGDSTLTEGGLGKYKRFTDAEAVIVGFQQLKSESGQRREELGAFIVRDCKTGIVFEVGTGYSLKERRLFWEKREQMKGLIVKYKHFQHGAKVKPRTPSFLGIRAPEDM